MASSMICRGNRVLVMGAGRSGISATRLLRGRGAEVILYDDNERSRLKYLENSELAHDLNLKTVFNQKNMVLPNDIKWVILSPGIGPEHSVLKQALNHRVPILNEIDLAISGLAPQTKLIGITGSNGKSTTTTMIETALRSAGFKATACGNLGIPLCDVVMEEKYHDVEYVVLELSSFQLEALSRLRLDHALILNITPNHLDRYLDFADYVKAKLKIIALLKPGGTLVLNESLAGYLRESPYDGKVSYFSCDNNPTNPWSNAHITGAHNLANAQAASLLLKDLGLSHQEIRDGLKNFCSLPHRFELVAQIDGRVVINDSKATTVMAVKMALSMAERPIHLLLGGIAKGDDFSQLKPEFFSHIKGYYLFGQAQGHIHDSLNTGMAQVCEDLESALISAIEHSHPGEIILLSPGCASYDQFDDYQHRGEVFKELAQKLLAPHAQSVKYLKGGLENPSCPVRV